jgi:putative addiction module killer protein
MKVTEYIDENNSSPYRQWLDQLDKIARARIQARVFRFEGGNLGDYKSVGKGVFEARVFFGPGYRIYFGIEGQKLLLLLVGGDKSTQRKDLTKAQGFWDNFRGEGSDDTKK